MIDIIISTTDDDKFNCGMARERQQLMSPIIWQVCVVYRVALHMYMPYTC